MRSRRCGCGRLSMGTSDLKRIKSIFAEALERGEADREAYLNGACGGDAALRAEVEAFLRASDRTGVLLWAPGRDTEDAQSGSQSFQVTGSATMATPGARGEA